MAKPASTVLMVRPAAFGFNQETAANNAFQHKPEESNAQIQLQALKEFDQMVEAIRDVGIEVLVAQDHVQDHTPDSIFPNNWFSTFGEQVILYSMFAENRRRERKTDLIELIRLHSNKELNTTLIDLEEDGHILEGTGSLVCDHENKTAYAALSDRTSNIALDLFETISGYKTIRFTANGPDGLPIYHTNVMMCVADEYIVIGLDSVVQEDKAMLADALKDSKKEIIKLSNEQVFEDFAGNMLQLANKEGEKFLLMSERAKNSLLKDQLDLIEVKMNNKILAPSIPTIENVGGGSVRCMLGEIYKG